MKTITQKELSTISNLNMSGSATSTSRRDFIKATSLTAGGLLLGGLPIGASAFAAGSETLKIALVGCGNRGTGAAFNALNTGDGVRLVAMADILQDRLDESYSRLTMRFGDTDKLAVPEENKFVGFDGYKQAIALADVVLLATPTYFRPLHFEEAVRQGKQMFMEKPLACDPSGFRRIMIAAEEAKKKRLNVVVGLQRRYQKCYREMYSRVSGGQIGDIISGQVFWNQGLFRPAIRQPHYSELEHQIRGWYYFIWLAGDQVLDQLIHNLDVANWFLGKYPLSAQGMGGSEVRTGIEFGENFDHHAIEYTYPGGIVISSQCRQIPGVHNRVDELFQGTRGSSYTHGRNAQAILRDRNGNIRYDHDGEEDPNPYQAELDELIASIRSGKVINDAEYGAKSSMTAIMGFMATHTGQLVHWDDAVKSTVKLMPDPEDITWDTPPPVVPNADGYYPKPVPGVSRSFLMG